MNNVLSDLILFAFPGERELIITLLILVIPSLFWLIALIQSIKAKFKSDNTKIIWILLIIFIPFLGMILWYIVGRGQRIKN